MSFSLPRDLILLLLWVLVANAPSAWAETSHKGVAMSGERTYRTVASEAPEPAWDESIRVRALITDRDRKGTNVRAAPAGQIIAVIPYPSPIDMEDGDNEELERRVVTLLAERDGWFQVIYDGHKKGWLHKSVLGGYACGTEDGDAHLRARPEYNASVRATLASDTPLRLLSVRGAWLKVSCKNRARRSVSGWLPPQCVWANPYRHKWH